MASEGTPVLAGRKGKMSSSLKERLKRTSRYFSSPVASKQLCQQAVPNTSSLPGSSNTEAVAAKSHLHLDGQHSVNTMDTNDQPSNRHNLDSTKACGGIEQLPLNEDTISCQNDKDNQPNQYIETSKTLLKKKECRQIAISSKSDEKVCATCKQNCKCKENEQSVERSKLSNTNSDCSASLESQDGSESTVETSYSSCSIDVKPVYETSCISKEYTCMDVGKLKTLKMSLEVTIKEKKDVIRKLKLVKMYRAKNDLTELQNLIEKWKVVCQEALQELHSLTTAEPKPTLTELIDHFQLDHQMIGYNEEDESFQ